MKKTLVKLVAVLLSLVIIMGISGAAFADAEHDDCDQHLEEPSEGEALRGHACDVCGNNMLDEVISYGVWEPKDDPFTTRQCPRNSHYADVLERRMIVHQNRCLTCGHVDYPYYVLEYAWYCPKINAHEDF